MYIIELLVSDVHFQYVSRRRIKSAPSIIVVERTCLSNNGRINWSKNLEMPVVGVFIDDTIGISGVPSYENRQSI